MAGRGRPKKSITEKLLAGTLEKSRIAGIVGKADAAMIPQGYIKAEQMPYFNAIAQHVRENEALQDVDSYVVSMAAQWLYIFHQAAEQMRQSGIIQVYEKTGAMAKHPTVQVMSEASAQLKVWFAELGMTPKSREALTSFQARPDLADDPFAELLK